jgi:hypothetical protein
MIPLNGFDGGFGGTLTCKLDVLHDAASVGQLKTRFGANLLSERDRTVGPDGGDYTFHAVLANTPKLDVVTTLNEEPLNCALAIRTANYILRH